MRAANSRLGPDGQCASIAGSRGVFCEKGLHGPVAADPQGDSYVQPLAGEEDRPFSRYLLNPASRDCTAADEQIDWSHARGPYVRDRFLYLSIANIRGVTSSR